MSYTTFTDSLGYTIINYGYMEYIWSYLTGRGLPDDGVAALMGNLYAESKCVPYIEQGDTQYPFSASKSYTDAVSNGTISENDFVYHGPNGGGYGLAQWTWKTRKQAYYNRFVSDGYSSIGDKELGCKFLWCELNGIDLTYSYKGVRDYIKNASYTLKQKTIYVLRNFENPENQSTAVQNTRYSMAHAIYEYLSGTTVVDPPDDESGEGGGSGGGHKPPIMKPDGIKIRNPALYPRYWK